MKKSYYAILILLISTLSVGCGKQKTDEETSVSTVEKEVISQTEASVVMKESQEQNDEEKLIEAEMEQITKEHAKDPVITPVEPPVNSSAAPLIEEQQDVFGTEPSGEAALVQPQEPTDTPAIKPIESPTQEPAADPTEAPTQQQPQEPVEQPNEEPNEEPNKEQDITIELPFVPMF